MLFPKGQSTDVLSVITNALYRQSNKDCCIVIVCLQLTVASFLEVPAVTWFSGAGTQVTLFPGFFHGGNAFRLIIVIFVL